MSESRIRQLAKKTEGIHPDRVEISNPCTPRVHGAIDSRTVIPFQKIPQISRFFLQLGWVEEVGSGMANVEKWLPRYSPRGRVQFLEKEAFNTTLWLTETPQVTGQADRIARLLAFCQTPRSREEMQEHLGLAHREHFRATILAPLLGQGQLELTLPDKPNSPRQKYRTPARKTP